MNSETAVLIVGAGPSGLALACELRRRGIAVRLIDAAPEPGRGSRAILLWPPALEVLADVDALDGAESAGLRATALAYHMGGSVLRLPLDRANAPLLLPQERTSGLLVEAWERLGGTVEWSRRVTDVMPADDSVTVKVEAPDGTQQTIEADWLVGADGVGSVVRRQLGVDFAGQPIKTTFLLAEGRIDGPVNRTEIHYFLGPAGVLLLAPLPNGVLRISGPVPDDFELSTEAVQRLLDQRGPGGLRVSGLDSVGTFTSQERIAATMHQGRWFLLGDAAHVHSVIGGQGLNLGLQDVRNLAWKLAGVIDGRLDPRVLASYDVERRAAAEQTVRSTSQMARQAVAGPTAARVRNVAWRLLQATGALRTWFAPMLAGRSTRLPDVLLGTRGAGQPPPRPKQALPVTRAPAWVPPVSGTGTAVLRLVTTGPADAALARRAAGVAQQWPALVRHEPAPRRKPGFLLVRPDGFVAARGRTVADLARVERSLLNLTSPGEREP